MDEAFATGLEPVELGALIARRDAPGLVRLGLQLALGVGSGVALVLAEHPGVLAGAFGAQVLVQLSCFATLHECVHETAFRSPALNRLGAWFAALCQLMSPPLMRAFHFTHHRHTHDLEDDPELAGLELMARWPRHVLWLGTVSGLPVLLGRLAFTLVAAVNPPWAVFRKALPFVRERRRRDVVWSSRLLVAIHAGVIALAVLVEPRLARLYPAVVAAHALLSVYITCEHRGLPTEGSIFERTRSFDPGALGRFVMWNMPYHAEHHAYPGVPFHALPALHTRLRPQLVHRVGGVAGIHLRAGRSPARAGA